MLVTRSPPWRPCGDEQKTSDACVIAVDSTQAEAHSPHTQMKMHEKEKERASEREDAENVSSLLWGLSAAAVALYKKGQLL